MEIVGGLTACELHLRALRRKVRICAIGTAKEGFLEPHGVDLFQVRDALRRGLHVFAEDLPRIDQQRAILANPLARCLKVVAVILQRSPPERPPAAFHRAVAALPRLAAGGQRLRRRVAKQLRGIGKLRIGFPVSEQLIDWCIALPAQQVPQRHLDSGEGVGSLQQVHAVHFDRGTHGCNVGRAVDLLAQHHIAHRLARAMRHGRHEGRDRDQRRGLALAPAFNAIGHHADHQRILAAVANVLHLGHGEIEEVDGFDAHDGLAG